MYVCMHVFMYVCMQVFYTTQNELAKLYELLLINGS